MVYNHGSSTHKAGEILYARDGLAVMLIPNGLLIGDTINDCEITEDRLNGMRYAFAILENPQQEFRLPENTGVAEGFAKVMHLLNDWRRSLDNPAWFLYKWLLRDLKNLFLVKPYFEKLMVPLAAGVIRDIEPPF